MSAGVIDPIEQALAADAPMHDVLDLVDAAIESATATGDSVTLDLLASSLDAIASERGQEWSRLSIAAARARAVATRAAATGPAPCAIAATDAPAASVPTPLTATADEQRRYAGWWLRTAAFVIDSLVLGFAYTLLDATAGGSDSSFLVLVWLGIPVAYPIALNERPRALFSRGSLAKPSRSWPAAAVQGARDEPYSGAR